MCFQCASNIYIYIDVLLYYEKYKNNIDLFYDNIFYLHEINLTIGGYKVKLYKMNFHYHDFSSIVKIEKNENKNKYLFNNKKIKWLQHWTDKNMTTDSNAWIKLKKKYKNFTIEDRRNKYNEFCMKYSHKGLTKTNYLYQGSIEDKVEQKLWDIICGYSNELSGLIKEIYKLYGYKSLDFKFEAFSIMNTFDQYFKKEHTDADGYLPLIAIQYFELDNRKNKGLSWESYTDYSWSENNEKMMVNIKEKDFLIFIGLFGDTLKHRPIGGNAQKVLTCRAPTKQFVYKKSNK